MVVRWGSFRGGWFLALGLLVAGGIVCGTRSVRAQAALTGEEVRCTGGQADRYSCGNVNLKSYLPIDRLGGEAGERVNDVWGWTDPQTGREYAIVGRSTGTAFVDVSDPTRPLHLGGLPSHSGNSLWRDIKVYENHALVVSEASEHGLQIFDLTKLRSVSEPPVTFSETAHYARFQTAHNVAVNEETGYAYVVGIQGEQDVPTSSDCGAGLHIVDVSTPREPEFAGCHTDLSTGGQLARGYTHDTQCVIYRGPDADYEGEEICFSANEEQVNIATVSDKSEPETITNSTYPKVGYVHQAWLTSNHRYLLVDDELDEQKNNGIDSTRTLVFDVSDLDNPSLVERFSGKSTSIDHNQYVSGFYSYQANYTSGLRILNVADPEDPTEAAYFDTYPSSDAASFHGAWSTYPFFESGIVVVSSIDEGLFVLEPDLSPILAVEARAREQNVTVRWQVSEGTETQRFEIEHRPPDGHEWTVVQTVTEPSADAGANYDYQTGELRPGTHQFRIRHVATDGTLILSPTASARVVPENAVRLTGLPNPIRSPEPVTVILRETQPVRVSLHDVLGRRVATLYDGTIRAGTRRQLTVPAPATGLYILRVQGESVRATSKVVVAR